MDGYFPKPPRDCENIKIEVDLSNYATKDDIKNITHLDTSNFTSTENNVEKFQAYDLSYFRGKQYFDEIDGK